MNRLTNTEIERLINCPKLITEPPKEKMALKNRSWRNNMKLQSKDKVFDFKVFMRKNEKFEEDFSIGLIYLFKQIKGDIVLLRCNGPHGENIGLDQHNSYHIHMADFNNIEKGLKPERHVYISKDYTSYKEAEIFFLKKCNIINAQEYFNLQIQLPFPI